MSNPPAFQYYPADLLSDPEVMFWDMLAIGCYWQMITFLWLNDGQFEYNIDNLRKLFRVNQRKIAKKYWKTIESKFILENGIVTHKRILKEMQKQAESRLKRQEAGRIGAEKRWNPDSNATADAISKPMAKNSSSTPTPIATPTPPSLIGIEGNSLDSEGLGLKQQIKIQAFRFIEGLEQKFHHISKDEATTFSRIAHHLSDQMLLGMPIEVFDEALGWAESATTSGVKNPKGLWVAKVKEQTGFTGRGKLLDDR